MRLLERLAKPKPLVSGFRGESGVTKESVLASVMYYLVQCLNYRLQPGAIENSELYQLHYQALANISEPKNWPGVVVFLEMMEPRLHQLSIRALSNNESAQATKQLQLRTELTRAPRNLFAVQYKVGQTSVQLAALALSNGRIYLMPVA